MAIVDTLITAWPLLSAVAVVLAGFFLWQLTKRFPNREEHDAVRSSIEDLSGSVNGLSTRVAAVENKVENMPTAREVNQILLAMEEVRGSQRELSARFDGLSDVLGRIEHPVRVLMEGHMKGGEHK